MAEQQQGDTPAPKPGDEIAVAYGNLDITRSFLRPDGTLYNEDPILYLRAGGDLAVYTDLLRDDQVSSAWSQRTSALVSSGWTVQPGADDAQSKAAAEFLTQQLEAIGWDDVSALMLYTRFYGYGVAELVWDVTPEGKLGWSKIAVRNRDRFLFTANGRCFLRTLKDPGGATDPTRIWCDPPNFWITNAGADHGDNPYGTGLAHQLYWPVRFKRDGMRFWMVFLEKFAMPTAVGKFAKGAGVLEKGRLLTAVMAIQTQAGVTIPDDMLIELLEAKRNGTGDYEAIYAKMDAAIQKIILGQTLTTEVGSTGGNRALGQVHMGVRQDIVKQDADLICESFNRGPARWITLANFPGAAFPKVMREIEEKEDLGQLATQLVQLKNLGYKPTLEFVQEKWGADMEEVELPPALDPNNPNGGFPPKPGQQQGDDEKPKDEADFAAAVATIFADQNALDGALDQFETRLEGLSRDLLNPVLAYVDGHSPAEVLSAMHDALPGYRGEKLEDALARVLFAGMVWGRANGAE